MFITPPSTFWYLLRRLLPHPCLSGSIENIGLILYPMNISSGQASRATSTPSRNTVFATSIISYDDFMDTLLEATTSSARHLKTGHDLATEHATPWKDVVCQYIQQVNMALEDVLALCQNRESWWLWSECSNFPKAKRWFVLAAIWIKVNNFMQDKIATVTIQRVSFIIIRT